MGTELKKLTSREIGLHRQWEEEIEAALDEAASLEMTLEEKRLYIAERLWKVKQHATWRDHYASFKDYLDQRWPKELWEKKKLSRRQIDGYLRLCEVRQEVGTRVPTATADSPACPEVKHVKHGQVLARAPRGKRGEAWAEAVRRADGEPTQEQIEEVVAEYKPPKRSRVSVPEDVEAEEEVVYKDTNDNIIPGDLEDAWIFHAETLPEWVSEVRNLLRRVNQIKNDPALRCFEVQAFIVALVRAAEIGAGWQKPFLCDCETDQSPCPICIDRKLRTRASVVKPSGGQRDPHVSPDQQRILQEFNDCAAEYNQLSRDEATRRISCYFTGRWAKRKKAPKEEKPQQEF